MSRKAQWIAVAIIFFLLGLFLMLMIAVASISTDDQPQQNEVSHEPVKPAYLETANIDYKAMLAQINPTTLSLQSYSKARIEKVVVDKSSFDKNWLGIKIYMNDDFGQKLEQSNPGDRDIMDQKMIIFYEQSIIRYLVSIGQSPDDKLFSVRASGVIATQTPTGKPALMAVGTARYSPNSPQIIYQAGSF